MRLLLLGAFAAGGWTAWIATISLTSPALVWHQLAFFVSWVLAWWGTLAIVAWGMSLKLFVQRRYRGSVSFALRQGLPPALVLGALAWLQSLRAISLAMAVILVGLALIAEFLLWPRGAGAP